MRKQFSEASDGVRRDAREHVAEPGKRLDAAPFAGSNEASQHRRCLTAAVAAEECPVAAANRDIALGRGNWTFFGSDGGGKTAAVLRSFIASCKRCGVEPFAWFRDVLSRIPAHSITRLTELLPHNWKPSTSPSPSQA